MPLGSWISVNRRLLNLPSNSETLRHFSAELTKYSFLPIQSTAIPCTPVIPYLCTTWAVCIETFLKPNLQDNKLYFGPW